MLMFYIMYMITYLFQMLLMEKSFVAWILHYLSELRQAANNPQTTKKVSQPKHRRKTSTTRGKVLF